MSYNASSMLHIGERITFAESGLWSFGPYRWGSRFEENRIFGVKPFRYLQELCGCVWNDKWTAGYSETLIHEDTPVTLEITDAGTVTTELGTFENCLKLTLNAELANQTNPNYYFDGGYRNVWCGRKEFIFAPGVGIVRFDFKWGNALDSSAVLVRYANPVRDKSYLPMLLGCEWEYDEVNLTAEGYRAKRIIKAACGMDGRYFAHDIQEFVYLGTEDEYEQFKRRISGK